jgi:hypothetical protein
MDEKMIFIKLFKVMIDTKRSSFDVHLTLRLTDRWFDGGAHLQAHEGDSDSGAVIDNGVFAKQN